MKFENAFYGTDGRLRSGWRFSIFVLGFVLASLVIGTATIAILAAISGGVKPGNATFLVISGVISSTVALAVGWLCGKYLEGLPFDSLGASFAGRWWINFPTGLIIGILTFSLAAGIGVAMGGLSFHLNQEVSASSMISTLLVTFLIFAVAAAFEEALFRGYILQTFVRSDLTWFGVLLTSTIFATVHNGNPSANILSWLNTFIAGIWFCIAYLKTRDLWLPFGLHLAWNWTQGSIFGVEVSGMTDLVAAPIMRETDVGPTWLTGGDYGIEGGVVTTIALVLSLVAIYFLPLKKD